MQEAGGERGGGDGGRGGDEGERGGGAEGEVRLELSPAPSGAWLACWPADPDGHNARMRTAEQRFLPPTIVAQHFVATRRPGGVFGKATHTYMYYVV